jgi:hypothetical protein
LKPTNQADGLMPHASDDNDSSSAAEDSEAGAADKFHDSDHDGSQEPSLSLFRQEQADENSDAIEDDDCEDNQSDYGSCPELCSGPDDDEDYQESESTPAAQSAAAVLQEWMLEKSFPH